jgi:hypothetical protein
LSRLGGASDTTVVIATRGDVGGEGEESREIGIGGEEGLSKAR